MAMAVVTDKVTAVLYYVTISTYLDNISNKNIYVNIYIISYTFYLSIVMWLSVVATSLNR